MIGIDACVSLLDDNRVEVVEVRTEDGRQISNDELKLYFENAERRDVNPIGNDGQFFCVWCISKDGEVIAFDVKNITNDKGFLLKYFEEEIYDYDQLLELVSQQDVFPRAIENENFSKVFDVNSSFVTNMNVIAVDDFTYPYKICREDFSFWRYVNNKWVIGCSDVWLLIYFKDGKYVNLCIADYKN